MKKLHLGLAIILVLSIMSAVHFIPATVVKAEGNVGFNFEEKYAQVEHPLSVKINGYRTNALYYYEWYVDNVIIKHGNDPQYIPQKEDINKFIAVKIYDLNDGSFIGKLSIYCSELPVIYIDTENKQSIVSKDEYIVARMKTQGNSTYKDDTELYIGDIDIKGRGNATWYDATKKPYKIKLDKKANLFGLGENKHWVLLANYFDSSLLKDKLAYDYSGTLGMPYMESTFVDVVLNGEYIGNYQLCEQIRIDKTRINITDWEEIGEDIAKSIAKQEKLDKNKLTDQMTSDFSWLDSGIVNFNNKSYKISDYYSGLPDITGGYLLELDFYYDEISKFTANDIIPVMINSPEYLYTSTTAMDYLKNYIEKFDNTLFADDFYISDGKLDKTYSDYVDFSSLINYWLVSESFFTVEGSFKSQYLYKDNGQLFYMGPIWDYDMSMGYVHFSSNDINSEYDKWHTTKYNIRWEEQLLRDPYFLIKAQEKYWENHKNLVNLISGNGIIDNLYSHLKESGEVNFEMWGQDNNYYLHQNSYKEAISNLKWWLTKRIEWLDQQFQTEESLVNSTGYYKADQDKLSITIRDSNNNICSKDEFNIAPADYVVKDGEDLILTVDVNDIETKKIALYINGSKYDFSGNGTYINKLESTNIDGTKTVSKCVVTIKNNLLTEKVGEKNVLQIRGMNSSDEFINSNFVTIKQKRS